jgi:glycosyltransferase involved in cell wall biosynthesis
MNTQSVVILGPAHPLRGGGLATFNERMARAFMQAGIHTTIYTFSLQYPNFLFPGTTQYSAEAAPTDLNIKVAINSINPFNWIKVGHQIKKERPDILIVRYWLPFMAPCLGTILRLVKKNQYTKIICIADNIVPHEKKFYDNACTKYFVKPVDAFLTMSRKVMDDLRKFSQTKAVQVVHPLYDNFGNAIDKQTAKQQIGASLSKKILLFFGFIRAYKGLDLLLEAIALLKQKDEHFAQNYQLVIAGEYYGAAEKYKQQINDLGITDTVIEHTHFIQDADVKNYFCAADVVVQPYKNATQSGVTPLAYHFNTPMIVTNVGALAENVPDGKVGVVCEPTSQSIANAITTFFTMNTTAIANAIQTEKKKYSWEVLVSTILQLAAN